jgi:hypothetical protein
MSEPMMPALEDLGNRHFSFYPAILNIEHNEWLLRQMSWSEILVVNAKTDLELWIPRRFVGEVSSVEEPVVIVGLRKELEYKAGTVWPHERRLFSMPRAFTPQALQRTPPEHKPPGAQRRPALGPEKKIGRLVGGVLLAGIAIILLAVAIIERPVSYHGVEQLALALGADDDYPSIVRKLGPPSEDHWRANAGELQYRAMTYKDRGYSLVLMGVDQKTARYIGAMDKNWTPVHYVSLPGGGNTLAMLRQLPKF